MSAEEDALRGSIDALVNVGVQRERLRIAKMLRDRATLYAKDDLPHERHLRAELWCIAEELDPVHPDLL